VEELTLEKVNVLLKKIRKVKTLSKFMEGRAGLDFCKSEGVIMSDLRWLCMVVAAERIKKRNDTQHKQHVNTLMSQLTSTKE